MPRAITGTSLWLGNSGDARSPAQILTAGFEAVVDLAMMCEPARLPRELVYLRFPLVDGADNPPWLLCAAVHTVESLARYGVPTLVACDGGMSRSVVIATAAAVGFRHRRIRQTECYVGSRPVVRPTCNRQLWEDVKKHA